MIDRQKQMMKKTSFFTRLQPICIYTLAAFFLFYEMGLQVSPSVMTSKLMLDLGIGAKSLGVMAAFYFYSYTVMQIPAGLLFDRYGPKYMITLASLVCGLGAIFFGMTNSFALAALGRFLMGVGSSCAFIGVLVVADRWFHPKHFAMLVGFAQFLAAFGAFCGELPLAPFINQFDWHNVMKFLGLVGILIAVLSFFIIKNKRMKADLIKRHTQSVRKHIVEIAKNSQTWFIAIFAFSSWAPVAIFGALWGVPYIMAKESVSNTEAAALVSMIWLGIAIAAPTIGFFSDYLGKRITLLKILSWLGLASSILFFYLLDNPRPISYLLLFLMGVASSAQILTFAIVREINRPTSVGMGIGLNNMAVVIGGALFQPLFGYILSLFYEGQMNNGVPVYPIEGYQVGLLIIPLCYLVGVLSSHFLIKETHCKPIYKN